VTKRTVQLNTQALNSSRVSIIFEIWRKFFRNTDRIFAEEISANSVGMLTSVHRVAQVLGGNHPTQGW